MSDFLSQFDSDKYKNEVREVKSEGIKGPEHKVEIEPEYKAKKRNKYIIISVILMLVVIAIIFGINYMNRVKVISFVGKDISELKVWALKNDIELDITNEFSIVEVEDVVIKQSHKKNSIIKKNSIMSVEVSKGPNQNEEVLIPNLSDMTYSMIRDWIDEMKLPSTFIIQEYSATIEKNKFIKKTFSDEGIDETSFKRKDSLTIYVSKGPEVAEKNIEVPDFLNKSRSEVDSWAKSNEINIIYSDTASNTVAEGMIVSQSISATSKLAKGDTLTISISIGKVAIVPDYSTVSKDDAETLNTDIKLGIKTVYSATVSYGKLISQSVSKGTKLYKDNKYVNLIYSEGKPFMDDLTGKLEKELPVYFYNFNIKGANITYTTNYVDSAEPKGSVIWTSKNNEYMDLTTNVVISVSKGNL